MIRLRVDVTTGGKLAFGKRNVRRVMARAANEIKADAAGLIRAAAGGGAEYGGHSASKPGAPPANRTGFLASSIKVALFRDGLGAVIKDTAKYALSLEAGAQGGGGKKGSRNKRVTKRRLVKIIVGNRVVAPRPFLSLALTRRAAGLDRNLRAAADADFDWVAGK